MAKATIVLSSRTEQENYILHKKLDELSEQFRGLEFVGVHLQGLASSIERNTAVVVFNLTDWTPRDSMHLDELRAVGYSGPVLVMAKSDSSLALKALRERPSVVFLEKPYELKDLQGIVRKFLLARSVGQQVYRRFTTHQEAAVESREGKRDRFISRVRNISKGGAFLEFLGPASFKVGEVITVTLELKDLQRVYQMPAKVVWTSKISSRAGGGMGVAFLGPGDIKRNIIGVA